jgi:uncharacterized membrane protein (DUF2068 family)
MRKIYPEALAFCVLWALLAVGGWSLIGWKTGLALSAGLFFLILPVSALILSKTGNFALERGIRWGILAVAVIALVFFADLYGTSGFKLAPY